MINLKLFIIIMLTSLSWFIIGFMFGRFIYKTKKLRDEKRSIFRKN